jgi:glutathione synthase/RimK-type ligase-like ATP-grasp enzyme
MILVITHKTDFTADFVIEKFNEKKIKYFRFNCEEINLTNYTYSLFDEQELHIGPHSQYSAVWFRRTMLPAPSPELSQAQNSFILQSYRCMLDNFFSLLNAKWLSHPEKITKAENKLFQLKMAREIGFQIPLTIVTNKKELVQPFFDSCSGNVIIKPIYTGRIESKNEMQLLFANKLKKEHIEKIEEFDLTPCIFQEFIEKELDIRVTVVGNSVFAASVDSQLDIETSVDWRRKKIKFALYKLPTVIEKKCIELTKKLGLSFGAIDIVKSVNGGYFFLEINPNGQWAWIEIDTGLCISEAIINFLN